jgi:WD40 repeat protein
MSSITVQKLHSLTGHKDSIYTLAPYNSSRQFFSASGDGMVVLWDLNQPAEGQLIARLPASVYSLHYHAGIDRLIAGQNFEGIHFLDVQNKKEDGSLQLTKAAIFDLQSSGNFLFAGTGDGTLFKINADARNITSKVKTSEKSVRSIAIDDTRGVVAAGYSDNMIRCFDLELNLVQTIRAHDNSVFAVRFSPDGKYLVSGSRDARLKFWNPDSGYEKSGEIVAHMYAINHLDYSPDKKHFVTCSLDKTIKVWDATELKLLKVIDRARYGGHATSVNKVLWTSYNDQILSASDDRTISVWHMIF